MARGAPRPVTDLQMLRKAQRSKLVVVALLAAAGVAAAVYSSSGPEGRSDDPAAIFVVRSGERAPVDGAKGEPARLGFDPYAPTLRRLGFTVTEGSFDNFVARARERIADADDSDIEAILRLADWTGHAYVAFEDPAALDLSELDLVGATVDASTGFAVISVGDYGSPRTLTVPASRSSAHRGRELDLLTALFAQRPLVEVADPEAKDPHEIFALRTRLEFALERLAEIQAADENLAAARQRTRARLLEGERGAPTPTLLGASERDAPLESVIPIALADGGILSFVRPVELVTDDGVATRVAPGETWQLYYNPPGTDAAADRQRCTSLRGGEVKVAADTARFRFAVAGDALLIDDGETPRLYTLAGQVGATRAPCSFVELGPARFLAGNRGNLGVPHGSGAVARTHEEGGAHVVSVLDLTTPTPQLTELLRTPESVELREPVWLDARHLAAPIHERDGQFAGVALLSRDHPGELVLIPADAFEDAEEVWQVAAVPPGPDGIIQAATADAPRVAARLVVAAARSFSSARLHRLDLSLTYEELFRAALAFDVDRGDARLAEVDVAADDDVALALDEAAPPEGEPKVIYDEPRPSGFTDHFSIGPRVHVFWPFADAAVLLDEHTGVTDPSVSPDGARVVFQIDLGHEGHEIAALPLVGEGGLAVLTDNDLDDHTPVFTADGARVVFRTRYKLERTTWALTAGRVLPAR
ncbi:MAG: hypothetical protein KC636_33930 [Myxococcales bacterium]|nr:hypothetical protein [Myxococcales bacterium]